MLFNQRIIHGDNGTLVDLSAKVNDLFADTATIAIVAADDKLYVGSDLPFNHRFFYVSSVNAAASVVTVDIWDGSAWTAAVDVVDQTSVAGATLARSGVISWTTARDASWGQEATTEEMTGSGITTLKIYDLYWVRLTFSGNLTGTTALQYVGHAFSDDEDLAGYYPDLLRSDVMAAHTTGKTSWRDQHCLAAEECIRLLRKKRVVWSPAQLVAWEQLNLAAIHKAAEIIYAAFGSEYEDRRALAQAKYREELDQAFTVDLDEDGQVDEVERRIVTTAGLYRT